MKFQETFVVHGSGKRRIRPSNWIDRLMDIVAAHWRGRTEPHPCGTCCECPDTKCFVFPVSLHKTHPALVQDLLFCMRMLEAPDLTAGCPRNIEGSGSDQKSAA